LARWSPNFIPFGATRFDNGGSYAGKEVCKMAKTEKGKKVVPVKPYTRKVDGKKVKVKRHKRSTPN